MSFTSAAAACAPAALADVAGPSRTHLRTAGHAERGVDSRAGELLEELGGGLGVAGGHLGRDLAGLGAVGVLGLDLLDLDHLSGGRRGGGRRELGGRAGLLHERLVGAGLEVTLALLGGVDAE